MNSESAFLTADAARYCTLQGRPTSASLLRKLRLKGPEDPGPHGPHWLRQPNGYCLYERAALDAWVSEYRAALKPMNRISAPAHLAASRGDREAA